MFNFNLTLHFKKSEGVDFKYSNGFFSNSGLKVQK